MKQKYDRFHNICSFIVAIIKNQSNKSKYQKLKFKFAAELSVMIFFSAKYLKWNCFKNFIIV